MYHNRAVFFHKKTYKRIKKNFKKVLQFAAVGGIVWMSDIAHIRSVSFFYFTLIAPFIQK